MPNIIAIANMIGNGGGGSSFNPATLNPVLWFDASNPSIFSDAGTTPCTDGSVVQQWTDLSTSGKNLTGTTTARPLFKTNQQGILPMVVFNDQSANHTVNILR